MLEYMFMRVTFLLLELCIHIYFFADGGYELVLMIIGGPKENPSLVGKDNGTISEKLYPIMGKF